MKELTCLYVEDEPFLREEIARFLKRRVGHLIIAENGQEGFQKYEQFPIDLIITDLKMPVMDGIDMTRKIRETNERIPVIITTALSDVELMQSSIEIGIERYLLKPIDITALTQALESVKKKIYKQNLEKSLHELNVEDSKSLERKIESDVAKIVKLTSGKGPQKVTAFLRANLIEIVIAGSRTPLEQTILEADENKRIADYVRETYYQQIQSEIENAIREITGFKAIWMSQSCNSQRDVDMIKLILEI
ncbi:Na-translocating system protein MpsC family protein [Fusibacter sp. 3D3]|uniref:Na-translocating system protein MpsC family protein n=1 Tax=Fusibacter sp. 3D3 TaxID=1048380 RepID=UPI0008531BB2|nr:Na-translocating system protein MpsC family protein [Fusibacter sp. 3D3]GAU78255.1 putative two-component response regulator [Fusibacter sp. 3D3]